MDRTHKRPLLPHPLVRAIRPAAWLAFCALAFTLATPSVAQTGGTTQAPAPNKPVSTDPSPREKPYVLLRADEVTYDQKNGLVTAQGKVEIAHNELVLRADTVTYDENHDKVTAAGNVVLLDESGDVKFFDKGEFTNSMKDGFVEGFRMLMTDNSRLAAVRGTRTGGLVTTLEKGVYSPCNLCKDNPSRPPFWRVRAVRVIHDSERKEVEYKDALLEILGVPVFYTPYLSHPDPTVKRRSGFLAPSYGSDTDFGLVVKTPYFWEISPSEDLTLYPQIMSDHAPLLATTYRRRFSDADLSVDLSGTQSDRTDSSGNEISGTDYRGHVIAKGVLDHDPIWRSTAQIARATDGTYLRRFKFPEPELQTLVTSLNTEGFKGNNYAQLSAYSFQGLRATDDSSTSPLVLPYAEYHMISDPAANGAFFTANTSALAIARDTGTNTRRLSLDGAWNLPYKAWTGEVYSLSASLRGDFYSADDVTTDSGQIKSGVSSRLMPQITAKWSYPFVRAEDKATQMIEPVAAIIAAPNGGNPDKMPNEDSKDMEFDDTNLFAGNRFTGVDRFDGGTRFIYGVNWGLYGNHGGVIEAFGGQSQSLRQNNEFPSGSGLREKDSDIVGRLRVAPAHWLNLLYRFRYDPDNGTARRHQVSVSTGPKALKFGLNYLFINDSTTSNEFGDREQLGLSFNAKLTPTWSATGSMAEDLATGGGPLNQQLSLKYVDECFTFQILGTRSFTTDRDIRPSDSLLFILIFKNLGEFTTHG